jgi:hypothetical protein
MVCGGRDGTVYGSGGDAEPGCCEGDSHIGAGRFAGVGFGDGAGSDRVGRVADYGDGYDYGWSGARGCGDVDRAVGRSTAETRRVPRKTFLGMGREPSCLRFFLAAHLGVLASR